jgi:alpha-soluble NSF attachment protein
MSDAQKAKELVEKAEQTQKKWLYISGDKWEDSLAMLEKAANLYKMAKNWEEAGQCYVKSVNCHYKLGSKYEAATAYQNAANCFRKDNKTEAMNAMQSAISIFTEIGRFATAAKLEKELAELCEEEENFEAALQHYQTAADYFDGENQKSSANQCIVKVAHLNATIGKYDDAIEQFEKAANNSVEDRLLKWGAKEFLFKAGVCRLARMTEPEEQIAEVQAKIEDYKDLDVHFSSSYECKLLDAAVPAFEKKDVTAFKRAMREYDQVQKLDPWKTNLFLKVLHVLEGSVKDVDLT